MPNIKILSVNNITEIIKKHGFDNIIKDLIEQLKNDFSNWNNFEKTPRMASHVKDGVIELMPICNDEYFSYKYVNGHPKNPENGYQTVVATGALSLVENGYPVIISEMTLLTALRTAATSALASDLLAKKDSHIVALLGTGAQSEFQLLAHQLIRPITQVRYYDIDQGAMNKFERNMKDNDITFVRCDNHKMAVNTADIIIVCTACKNHVKVVKNEWVKEGMHINGIGGDCPGKTELDIDILKRSKVVVEFFEQSFIEGEIQRFSRKKAEEIVNAHLYQLVNNEKTGRENDTEITVFDSVGFALEDYSVLKLFYDLAEKYNIGTECGIIPNLDNPKNLFSIL